MPNLERPVGVTETTQTKRLDLLGEMEKEFEPSRSSVVADSMRAATGRAVRLMRPEAAAAFRLEDEKDAVRESYGRNPFGQGCLLARRLVERGVAFVEVTLDGWDTHQNNFTSVQRLAGTLDGAFAALLADLKERGLLDSTLIVCQGEFGRTPKINGNHGRDHWPASWAVALAGGGIKGGQVIGKTTADGMMVDERPGPHSGPDRHGREGHRHRPAEAEHVERQPSDPHRRPGRQADQGGPMNRCLILGVAGVALAACGLVRTADPPVKPAPRTVARPDAVELVLLGGDKLVRVRLQVEVDGKPLAAVWDDTFARLFAFFDRNGDGVLDEKEAARLPSAFALRQVMGSGFTPPVGTPPPFADLDVNGDAKVTPLELAAYYRRCGLGNVLIGVGRLPASAELAAALLKDLDTDGDGKVSEKEWKAAANSLKKLDRNDDELIGVGELVPHALYPGAAATTLLTPPTAADTPAPDVAAAMPVILLPADEADTHWAAAVIKRRDRDGDGYLSVAETGFDPALFARLDLDKDGKLSAAELAGWQKLEPDARWVIRLGRQPGDQFALSTGRLRLETWIAEGKLAEASGRCSPPVYRARSRAAGSHGNAAPAPGEQFLAACGCRPRRRRQARSKGTGRVARPSGPDRQGTGARIAP